MKVDIEERIKIPENIEVEVKGGKINIKSEKGVLERSLFYPGVKISKQDDSIILKAVKASKNEKRLLNTFKAHIKNMIKGLEEEYDYKLKICSSHFPMNVSVDGNFVIVKNFLGEKAPRKAKIIEGTNVDVDGDEITVRGSDKEKVGQTAANIEASTRITGRDRRVFADGIFITKKVKWMNY